MGVWVQDFRISEGLEPSSGLVPHTIPYPLREPWALSEKSPNLPVQAWNVLRIPGMGCLSPLVPPGVLGSGGGCGGVGSGPGRPFQRKDKPASAPPHPEPPSNLPPSPQHTETKPAGLQTPRLQEGENAEPASSQLAFLLPVDKLAAWVGVGKGSQEGCE